jgi:hypothetical protein
LISDRFFLAVYAALKIRSTSDIGRHELALAHLVDLEKMEQGNTLVANAGEARWVVNTLQNMLNLETLQDEVRTRVENLIRAINERLMSTYPLLSLGTISVSQENIWEELEAAGYTRGPVLEHRQHLQQQQLHHQQQETEQQVQLEQEQKEEQTLMTNDDDEMADTAGRLLERVADNTSEKFQNSQFLSLMRKLRDREVKVEGDKMVEVSAQSSSSAQAQQPIQQHSSQAPQTNPPSIPVLHGIDPTILDHVDTDFSLLVYPDQGHVDEYALLSRQSSNEPATDEISGQFRYYNVHAAYHR